MRHFSSNPRYAAYSDDDLVTAAASGDREAIVEFLVRNWELFVRVAQKRAGTSGRLSHGVDDLMSTTTRQVMAMVQKGRFIAQGAAKARGLVTRILGRAINRTFERSSRERRRLVHRGGPMQRSGPAAGELDASIRAERLLQRFRSLSESDYRLLVMRFSDDQEFKYVAAALGCSEDAARQRWSVLRKRLEQMIIEADSRG